MFRTNLGYEPDLVFSIVSGDLPNKEFKVTGAGEVVLAKTLDFETRTEFVFRVAVTLGRQRDRAEIRVTVLNVNDWNPAFRHPEYQFHVSEAEAVDGHRVGVVEVSDGDLGDRVSLELRGEMAAVFGADSDTGALYLRQLGRMAGGAAAAHRAGQRGPAPLRLRPRHGHLPGDGCTVKWMESLYLSQV